MECGLNIETSNPASLRVLVAHRANVQDEAAVVPVVMMKT